MSPPPVVGKKALLFPWGVTGYHLINIDYPADAVTLGADDGAPLAAVFEPNPAACSRCLKPYLKHCAFPNFGFSVFTGCTHGTDLEWEKQYPNKCVAALLPNPLQTCFGCVVVVKHPLSTDPAVSNRDLPVLDVEKADIPHLTELVRRSHSSVSESFALSSFSCPCSALMASASSTPPLPVYDIDEIFASLTLEEQAEVERPPPRRRRRARTSDGSSTRVDAPPSTPPRPLTPDQPVLASLSETATLYRFSSPTKSGLTEDWSEAAHAMQTASAQVRAMRKPRKKRSKKVAYVVFRGRHVGIMSTWHVFFWTSRLRTAYQGSSPRDEVEDAISGIPFAIHKGFASRETAMAAFQHAEANAWTSTAVAWTSLPISMTRAPLPVADATPTSLPAVATRDPKDPWYVVYAGINPGIFPTSVECMLNVLGIQDSVYESVPTFSEAQAKFARALRRGEVSVQRRRAD
ncbi:hypothetical protein B0H11DRAFT_2256174 [Mycena galericulata]|nr:hypothetical protein B0H11DRAFT_2256174 [Mycena galericulata]